MQIINKRFYSPCLLAVSLVTSASWGKEADATQLLKEFHSSVKTFEAQFAQSVRDEKGKEIQKSSGTVYLLRPGKFRWDYLAPDKQMVVSNGSKIWIYDPGLEQVTVKSLASAIGQTPARVLTESRALETEFKLNNAGSRDGLQWVNLTPKSTDGNYKSIEMGFATTLKTMIFKDNIGNVTRIEFSQTKLNPVLKHALFNFTVPKGVDVVDVVGDDELKIKEL